MVAGRVGSGIAAELGSMMVTDQIAALRALGTDPIRKLVVPRILAGVVMLPLLTSISCGVGMVGGWLVTVGLLRVASSVYWNSVVQGLYIQDVWMGLIKPVFLGFAIVSIGCHVGLRGDPGRGTGDHQRRRGQLRGCDRRRFPGHAAPHRPDVLVVRMGEFENSITAGGFDFRAATSQRPAVRMELRLY
jgi:hypothetical protein